MTKYFSEYKIEPESESSTRLVHFYNSNGKLISTSKLTVYSLNDFIHDIKKNKIIDIENALIEDFSFSKFKNLNIDLLRFKATNCLFINKNADIDFSETKISVPEIDFSGSVFSAPGINFSGTEFNARIINFEDVVFKAENNVSFSKSIFRGEANFKHTVFSNGTTDFQETRFSDYAVNFTDADFNDGDTLFTGANFGNGKTGFKIARFGNGKVDFSRTNFGKDETSFEKAEFGNGDISFRSAVFHNGRINFISVNFGKGKKSFINTEFGHGNIYFKNSNFNDGKISFRLAVFGKGIVDFHYCTFGKGDIIFDSARFQDGLTDFRAVNFGQGKVSFKRTAFGHGDIIFLGASQESGSFLIQSSVLGNGEFNFEETDFSKANVYINNVNFGLGKVSFKKSVFNVLSLNSSQLDNFFDLRIASCKLLDLSDTVVKDIVDLAPYDREINIQNIKLSGMRLLGRIYIDWRRSKVKELIYNQDTSHKDKEEQFRILKENYSSTGQYSYEDEAYVEFKRCEAQAHLEIGKQNKGIKKGLAYLKYVSNWLIFDKMGKYATAPLRVLITMGITYLAFTSLYLILAEFGNVHIISSLFEPDDPRCLSQIGKAFYHSAITFLTIGYGDYYPDGISRWISSIEGFVGLFQMSYFTVAFARKALR